MVVELVARNGAIGGEAGVMVVVAEGTTKRERERERKNNNDRKKLGRSLVFHQLLPSIS